MFATDLFIVPRLSDTVQLCNESIYLFPFSGLGNTDQQAVPHVRIIAVQGKSRDNVFLNQPLDDIRGGDPRIDDEFVEERSLMLEVVALEGGDSPGRVMRFLEVLARNFLQAAPAHGGEVNRRHQREQALIGAYVRGGFLSPDMLFAGRQSQNVSAIAVMIKGLSRKAPRHLADIFFKRREQTQVGAAIAERYPEALTFAYDDV